MSVRVKKGKIVGSMYRFAHADIDELIHKAECLVKWAKNDKSRAHATLAKAALVEAKANWVLQQKEELD